LLSPAGLAPHPPIEKQVPSHQVNSRFMSWAGYLWEKDFTPQAYVRLLGHWGSNTVGKSLSRRFGSDRWLPEETAALTNYLYHISALPASGEYALNAILKPLVHMHGDQQRPHVYAREPIHPSSLAPLSPQRNSYCPEIGIPILLLYGDDDWICFPDVEEYVNDVKREGVDIKLSIIRNAGHHLYMDNVDHCHEEINKWHDRVKHYRNKSRVQAECKDDVSDH
jgi:cardiolipin-specific phospholipase